MKRRIFTAADITVIAFVIGFSVLILIFQFSSGRGKTVKISCDNEVITELPLNEDGIFSIDGVGGTNTVVIEKGKCYISYADCRDNICVKHSPISKIGETIVCLPHRLIAEVE